MPIASIVRGGPTPQNAMNKGNRRRRGGRRGNSSRRQTFRRRRRDRNFRRRCHHQSQCPDAAQLARARSRSSGRMQADNTFPSRWTVSYDFEVLGHRRKIPRRTTCCWWRREPKTSNSAGCGERRGLTARSSSKRSPSKRLPAHDVDARWYRSHDCRHRLGASSTTFSVLRNLKVVLREISRSVATAHRRDHAHWTLDGRSGPRQKEAGCPATSG